MYSFQKGLDFIYFLSYLNQSMQNRSFFLLLLTKGAAGVGDPNCNKKGGDLHTVSGAELYCREHLSI